MATLYVNAGYVNAGYVNAGIVVNWAAKEIFIPRNEMTIVQLTPIEIRNLDVNALRLILSSLLDDPAGIIYPDTHVHVPPTPVGGVELARVLEIVNDYTVTFEDGQYAVNITGGNSNIADRININNVSVRSANSAGLVQKSEIEFASYGGGITIDVTNGVPGQAYPIGAPISPVNNLTDAQFIVGVRGLPKNLFIEGNLTVEATESIAGYSIRGKGATLNVSNSILTYMDGCSTHKAHIYNCLVTGWQGGENFYTDCIIDGLVDFHCTFERCGFKDGAALGYTIKQSQGPSASHVTYFKDCYGDEGPIIIDRDNARPTMVFDQFKGHVVLKNQNHVDVGDFNIHMNGGSVTVDVTCTTGNIFITGDCEIINNTGGSSVRTGILQSITDTRMAIESTRATHQGYGDIYYVDPLSGLDTNDGRTQYTALKTYSKAETYAISGQNDVILFVNPSTAGTIHNEDIIISKNNIHVRAISRDITFKAATPNGDIVVVNGNGCSIAGALIDGDRGGAIPADNCIKINGKFCLLDSVWLKQANVDCLTIRGGDYHEIRNGEIEKANRHGISIFDDEIPASGSPREISLTGRGNIYLNDGDGVHIGVRVSGSVLGQTTRFIRILNGEITRNLGFGIHAEAEVEGLTIHNSVIFHGNNGGHGAVQKNILTDESHDDREEHHHHQAEAVWSATQVDNDSLNTMGHLLNDVHSIERRVFIDTEALVNGNGRQGTPFNILGDAIDFAETHGIPSLWISGSVILDRNLKNFTIFGIGVPEIDTNGQDLKGSHFHECRLTGSYTNSITARSCLLRNNFLLNGFFENSVLEANIICAPNSNILMKDMGSFENGSEHILNIGTGPVNISLAGYQGKLAVAGSINALNNIDISGSPAQITLNNTNTAGNITVRGFCTFVDNSAGATVTDQTGIAVAGSITQGDINNISDAVWNKLLADMLVAGSAGERLKSVMTLNQYLSHK